MDPITQAAQQSQTPTPTPEDTLAATNGALLKKQKTLNQQANDQNMAAISAAAALLSPKSQDSQVRVGKAVATPAYAGFCLKWVDDQQGKSQGRQPTAYADYQSNANQGNINTSQNIPEGARIYFAPDESNGNMGHVGIANKNGSFTSATDNGIKTFSLPDWIKYTGQKFLGWAK